MLVAIDGKRNYPFRFEKMWLSHPLLEDGIMQWWNIHVVGFAMFRVAKKLRFVKDMLEDGIEKCLAIFLLLNLLFSVS